MDLTFNPNTQSVFLLGQIILDYNQNQTDASSRGINSDGVGDTSSSGDSHSRVYNPEAAEFYPIHCLGPPKVYIHGPTHYEIIAGSPPIPTHFPFSLTTPPMERAYPQPVPVPGQYQHHHRNGHDPLQSSGNGVNLTFFQQRVFQPPPPSRNEPIGQHPHSISSSLSSTVMDNHGVGGMRFNQSPPTSNSFPQTPVQNTHGPHYSNSEWTPGEIGFSNTNNNQPGSAGSFCSNEEIGTISQTNFQEMDNYISIATSVSLYDPIDPHQHHQESYYNCEGSNESLCAFNNTNCHTSSYNEFIEGFVNNTSAESDLSTSRLEAEDELENEAAVFNGNSNCLELENDGRFMHSLSHPEVQTASGNGNNCFNECHDNIRGSLCGNGNGNFNPFAREFYPISLSQLIMPTEEKSDKTQYIPIQNGESGDCDCNSGSTLGEKVNEDKICKTDGEL